jgi:tetratricopeptide (TPR) repeat protein
VVTRWTRVAAWIARTSKVSTATGTAVAGAALAASPHLVTMIAVCGTIPVWLVARAFAERELARLPSYQADAHARGDAEALAEVRRVWTNIGAKGPRADALAKVLEGEELALREKWKESRAAFVAVDLSVLPEAYATNVKDWIAYVTAQAGDPLRALDLIDAAIAGADDETRPSLEHTRARVLVLLGRPADALPALEASVKEAVHDRALNARYYWLAMANDGLGNDDEARQAFERAASLEGPFKEKARKALAAKTPFRG